MSVYAAVLTDDELGRQQARVQQVQVHLRRWTTLQRGLIRFNIVVFCVQVHIAVDYLRGTVTSQLRLMIPMFIVLAVMVLALLVRPRRLRAHRRWAEQARALQQSTAAAAASPAASSYAVEQRALR